MASTRSTRLLYPRIADEVVALPYSRLCQAARPSLRRLFFSVAVFNIGQADRAVLAAAATLAASTLFSSPNVLKSGGTRKPRRQQKTIPLRERSFGELFRKQSRSQPGRRRSGAVGFDLCIMALYVGDVVAHNWRRIALPSKQHLEDKLASGPKHQFGTDEIELPHSAKALIIHISDLCATGLEAPAPVVEGLGIVQTQEFNIGHPQARALNFCENFGQRRRIGTGEDILPQPGACGARRAHVADGMQQHQTVIGQQRVDLGEELGIAVHAYMLEHANRNDAIEALGDFSVVQQVEAHAL